MASSRIWSTWNTFRTRSDTCIYICLFIRVRIFDDLTNSRDAGLTHITKTVRSIFQLKSMAVCRFASQRSYYANIWRCSDPHIGPQTSRLQIIRNHAEWFPYILRWHVRGKLIWFRALVATPEDSSWRVQTCISELIEQPLLMRGSSELSNILCNNLLKFPKCFMI